MEQRILFETTKTTIHLWPYDYCSWRGFYSKNHVVVTEDEIQIDSFLKKNYKISEIEFCNVKKRWFGFGNPQLSVGVYDREGFRSEKNKKLYEKLLKRERENEENKDEASDTENAKKYGWKRKLFFYDFWRFYLPQKDIDQIISILKEKNALCYRDNNISVGTGKRAMWMNKDRIVSFVISSVCYGLSTKDVEFAAKGRRFWGLLKPRFTVGVSDSFNFKYNWVNFDTLKTNCSSNEISKARAFLKANDAICYSEGSSVVNTPVSIWKRLFSGNNSLWMNSNHIIIPRSIWGIDISHGIIIPQIKFFYTKGILSHDLYLGAMGAIRVENVSSSNKSLIEQHLKNNGAKIALDSLADYNDVFTIGDLFKIKNWFASSTISVTKNGVKMTQKTFKTNDNIFLPYDKINFAETYGGHSLLGARHIRIYGEQHIMPIRKYSKSATKEILKCLEEHGIRAVKGEKFAPSYHSSWIGIVLSIATLSIWHWIVVFFTSTKKRSGLTLDMSQKKASWEGPLYVVWKEKNEDPKKDEGSKLTFEVSDVTGMIYYKKSWYHLWGYLCMSIHPYSFRTDQLSKDYTFLLGKCWSWNAKNVIRKFVECGHTRNYSNDTKKNLKWWAKYILKKMA